MDAHVQCSGSEFGIWEIAAPAPPLAALDDALDAETVIIGAGYTGLSTALHLSQKGASCVVLEAREPGAGASGRNTGWLEPNWWLKKPSDIDALFGPEKGARLTRWIASGPRLLDDWITRYGLDIQLDRSGLLLATARPGKAKALEEEARQWQAAGIDYPFLDGTDVARHVASRRFCGGLLLRSGAVLNPLSLSRELARACRQQDVRIFGNTPVAGISRDQTAWRLSTPRAQVRCRRLILATDAYTGKLWPELAQAYATWRLAVIASEPYEALNELLPLGTAFADMDLANILTLRRAQGERLVTSTFSPLQEMLSPTDVAEPFMRKFRKVFPSHPQPRWQYAHYGDVGLSRDMLPKLCAIGPQAWTVYGYSGTGINLALLFGGELARLVESDDANASIFPVTRLEPLALRGAINWGLRWLYGPISRRVISHIA